MVCNTSHQQLAEETPSLGAHDDQGQISPVEAFHNLLLREPVRQFNAHLCCPGFLQAALHAFQPLAINPVELIDLLL